MTAFLRVPLLGKLLGANLLIVLGAVVEPYVLPAMSASLRLSATLLISFAATAVLVWLALRPIAQLEATADRVSGGDFKARVPASPIADRDVARLAATLNRLLDRVESDRARIEYLAGRAVRARDIERESVARELRDSLAQMVSGIALGLASVQQRIADPDVDRQIESTRVLLDDLTEQMRSVAEALHPGTIGEFGLGNALKALARIFSRRSNVIVDVEAHADLDWPPAVAGALYRVADEALRNVVQHSQAASARVALAADASHVRLDIEDDGRGFDVQSRDPLHAGLGLFSASALLALAGGELQISAAPGRGKRVTARITRPATPGRTWRATSSE